MNENVVLGAALAMMLIALPLLSFGTNDDIPVLWWSGLGLLALGGTAGTATRFVLDDGEEDDP